MRSFHGFCEASSLRTNAAVNGDKRHVGNHTFTMECYVCAYLISLTAMFCSVQCQPQCRRNVNCSLKETLPCVVRSNEFCRERLGEFSRPSGELSWTGRARDFTVHAVEVPCPGSPVSGLYFQWRPPLDGSLNQLKGFQLLVSAVDGQHRGSPALCRLFDVRNVSWTTHDVDEVFHFTLFPLPDGTKFSVQLISLPTPEVQHRAKLANILMVSTPPRGPSVWKTGIDWSLDINSNNINVTFDVAPKAFNFLGYDVILMELTSFTSTQTTIQIDNVDKPSNMMSEKVVTLFQNVSPGEYEIQVRPFGGSCQNDCKTSRTSPFHVMTVTQGGIEPGPQQLTVSEYGDGFSTPGYSDNVIKTAVGCVLAGVAVVCAVPLLVFYIMRRKRGNQFQLPFRMFSQHTNKRSNVIKNKDTKRLLSLDRKLVFLIYSADNEPFLSLIGAFACYLQTYCLMDILHVDWCFNELRSEGIQSWVRRSLHSADAIIVVQSAGALTQFSALMEGAVCQTDDSSLKSCLFVDAVSEILESEKLKHKCISVTFQEDHMKYFLSFNKNDTLLKLMTDFKDLLLRVHNVKECESLNGLPHSANHVETEEGRQLQQAIADSNIHSELNPDWYEHIFPEEEIHQDSKHGNKIAIVSVSSSGYSSQEKYQFVEPEVITDDENSETITEQLRDINAQTQQRLTQLD